MPRACNIPYCREQFVFAITAKDPSSICLSPPDKIKPSNQITSAEGYLGNIAIQLEVSAPSARLTPMRGKIWTQPSFAQSSAANLTGNMYYEIHPQIWGQGIMSEAFVEVLRFAMEEVGCSRVITNPMDKNEASIKICVRSGMRQTGIKRDAFFGKRQAFHEISRKEWWARNRPGDPITDAWGGKEVCRWCLNFRLAPPTIRCTSCEWARYCSRECQRADRVRKGGHQEECDHC